MTLRLTIDEQAWRAHVAATVQAEPTLIPVVKGNGYGFGRTALTQCALQFADQIAVGTVHELADVCSTAATHAGVRVLALTPAIDLPAELPPSAELTVAASVHVDALRRHGWRGAVAVKLASSMLRHGVAPELLDDVLADIHTAGCHVQQYVVHLPLPSATFTQTDALQQVDAWTPRLDPTVALSVSHLTPVSMQRLREANPHRTVRLRTGTALWHGDKSFVHLSAQVLDVRPVRAGDVAGYRQQPVPGDGHLVMIGAGSAHGVTPVDQGLSPFHHARRRLTLIEPPHMHTSMAFVGPDQAVPAAGDWVDVQRPLITVTPDVVDWR
jgi:alanine racemase